MNMNDLKLTPEEQFTGMWKDRQDMKDSASWVCNVRKKEWLK